MSQDAGGGFTGEGGVRFANACVTTSLCSPSRPSILTGLYAHTHGVVDNQSGMPEGLRFFSQDLQDAGYEAAVIGKWHIGHASDEPRSGWTHWVSLVGQGNYFPDLPKGGKAQLNVNGRQVPQTKYITDELTDYAIDWLTRQKMGVRPWMLCWNRPPSMTSTKTKFTACEICELLTSAGQALLDWTNQQWYPVPNTH